jgi:hypothetical protein
LRLAEQIERSINAWSLQVRHNFNEATRHAVKLADALGVPEMDRQCQLYDTSTYICSCGQTRHARAMFERDVPCWHRYARDAIRPKMVDPPTLSAWDMIPKYRLRVKTYDRVEEVPTEERKEFLVRLAAEKIKRRSGTGQKIKVVTKWMDDNFPSPDQMTAFVQKISLAVLIMITDGVNYFVGLAQQQRQ